MFTVIVFTLSLNKQIPKSSLERKFLIKNFKLNKEILIKRIKLSIVSLLAIILLIFIGLGRTNGWKNTNNIIFNVRKQMELRLLPTAEFRAVNYTIDFVQARPYLTMEKSKDTFTWDKMIFYPLPTYVYKKLFNKKSL